MKVSFEVNGRDESVEVEPSEVLLDTLRDRLYLTGTKDGCREGECGACTVLINGKPVNACLQLAAAVNGRKVETVESVGANELSHVQAALVENGGIQCGFCTPGFVMTLTALLRRDENPAPEKIRAAVCGNICRCTGYTGIVTAVEDAACRIKGSAK